MQRRLTTAIAVLAFGLAAAPAALAGDTSGADDPAQAAPGELIVGFAPGTSDEARDRAVAKASGRRKEKVSKNGGDQASVELVEVPRGSNANAIAELEQDPAVEYAEPNWVVTKAATSNDAYFTGGSLWGMYGDASSPANQYGSQAAEAWAANHTGSGNVYVGIIDEGFQTSHPDLAGNAGNPNDPADGADNDGNGYADDTYGWDFYSNNNSVYDGGTTGSVDDHGTHVAGTIGALGGNGAGVAGVNWDVGMISGKFLGPNGGYTSDAIEAVDYFTGLKQRGVNIVATNNSWGGGGYSQALSDAITRGARQNILFVAAAGNSKADTDRRASYPSNYNTTSGAGYDAVISVAAIASNGTKPRWSNYGATTVDLGAPGDGIWSTLPYNRYGSYSGTSMATPHVTGGAALYASTHPGATAAQTRNALLSSVVPTSSMAGKTVTGGRLNVSGF
jgi:subtilisin family serine protease